MSAVLVQREFCRSILKLRMQSALFWHPQAWYAEDKMLFENLSWNTLDVDKAPSVKSKKTVKCLIDMRKKMDRLPDGKVHFGEPVPAAAFFQFSQTESIKFETEKIMDLLGLEEDDKLLFTLKKLFDRIQRNVTKEKDIFSRIEHLISAGCLPCQISWYPKILLLQKKEISKRVARLQSIGCETVSVDLLDITKKNLTDEELRQLAVRHLILYSEYRNDTKEEAIRKCLNVTPIMFEHIQEKLLGKKLYNEKLWRIIDRIVYLCDNDLQAVDIVENCTLLEKTLENLQRRVSLIRKSMKNKPLHDVIEKTKSYTLWGLQKKFEGMEEGVNKDVFYMQLAQLLEVDVERVKVMKLVHMKNVPYLLQKVEFLLSKKVTPEDIIRHEVVLTRSLEAMSEGAERAKKIGKIRRGNLTMAILHAWMPTRKMAKRATGVPRNHKMILELIGSNLISHATLVLLSKIDMFTLKSNFEFLQNQGFATSHLLECPPLLAHRTEVLKKYFEELETNLGETTLAAFADDKIKLLNALQYTIEVDHDFQMIVRDVPSSADRLLHPVRFPRLPQPLLT